MNRCSNDSLDYTLLTGATGLVGRYLLRDLLLSGQRLAVIVRPGRKTSVHERVEAILQLWEGQLGHELARPLVFAGDITQEGLGLADDDRRQIVRLCGRVIHNAASLQFVGRKRTDEPWVSNLRGVLNVLDFCRELGLADLHHVSTAYVCGLREGAVLESDLAAGQHFRNPYEQSKYEAELAVRSADFLKRLTVYRPVVICGDSSTGYTSSYHGLHLYQRYMSLLINSVEPGPDGRRHVPMRIYLNGDERRNVVPVDWVSAVVCRLLATPEAWGRTFHLAPPQGIPSRVLFQAAESYFNCYGAEFVGRDAPRTERVSEWDRLGHEIVSVYSPYDTTDPPFDTSNLLRFAGDIPCPELDEPMLLRFFRYGDEDRWGKRPEARPSVPPGVEAGLLDWLARHNGQPASHQPSGNGHTHSNGDGHAAAAARLGLDVTGPGGGQWTALRLPADGWRLERGLPTEGAEVFTLSAAELAEPQGLATSASVLPADGRRAPAVPDRA